MDPVLRWTASVSSNVNKYTVAWSRNGVAAGSVDVPQSAAGDASGYATDWNAANPGVTLAPGDVLFATVTAVDTTDNLSSTPVVSNSVTIPTPVQPPAPPTAVVLSLT
jgi:hypothetical protein